MKHHFLSPLLLSGLLLLSPQMTLEARSQSSTFACENYSPEAARREIVLLSAIEQARQERSQSGFGLSNIKAMLSIFSRFMPNSGGGDIERITGILEQVIGFTGASIPEGSPDNSMTEIFETLGDRIFSLANRSPEDLDPTQVMGILTEMAGEVQSIRSRQPRSSSQQELASLNRELENLREQCRRGSSIPSSRPPVSSDADSDSDSAPLSSPPPIATDPNNSFVRTCESQGGIISTYYEGERVSEDDSELQYYKMVECIPGQTALETEGLRSACTEANGTWIEPRSIPLCRF